MSESRVIQTFSEDMASRLTGVSVGQLRYWDRAHFFSPTFGYEDRSAPFSRLYSFRDIVSLKVLNRLRNEAKIPLQHLRLVKEKLVSLGDALWADTALYAHAKRVAFVNPETAVVEEVVSGQAVLKIVLRVEDEDMREAIERLHQRRAGDVGRLDRKRNIANNQLVIAGTRIPVANVKAFADAGYSIEKIKAEYPTLTEDDIQAAIDAKAA